MRSTVTARAVLLAAALLGNARPAQADGGTVRIRERVEPFIVTVFTSPTPLRAGLVDLSVMVQDLATGEPLLDGVVTGRVRLGEGLEVAFTAELGAGTNGLLYSALFELPAPGSWRVVAEVGRGGATRTVEGVWDVARPLPAWTAFWPWLALPVGLLVLLVIHQALRERQAPTMGPWERPDSAADSR